MELILNNKITILLILLSISLFVYIVKQQKKTDKLEKQINTFNQQNIKYLIEIDKYKNNMFFLKTFISFYVILTDILTSKLGAKADGFTYRTFDYKKENGVTIEKKVNTKKVRVKGEVGYIIKDTYFIKKADLDNLLIYIKDGLKEEYEEEGITLKPKNYFKILAKYPTLFNITVEDVRGDNIYKIND